VSVDAALDNRAGLAAADLEPFVHHDDSD
jgi:hypothetical protein